MLTQDFYCHENGRDGDVPSEEPSAPTWKIPWQFISLSLELGTSVPPALSCSPSMLLGKAAKPVAPLEAWEQANQEELPNCRLGTEGMCSLGRTIRLTSTLEELAGDDRRERAQSESSTCVNCPSENILLLLLLSGGGGGGGATAFRRGWHTGISRAGAPVLKLI